MDIFAITTSSQTHSVFDTADHFWQDFMSFFMQDSPQHHSRFSDLMFCSFAPLLFTFYLFGGRFYPKQQGWSYRGVKWICSGARQ